MLRVDFRASKAGGRLTATATVDESECVSPFDPEAVVEAMKKRGGGGGAGGAGENGIEAAAAAAAAAAVAVVEREAKRPKKEQDEEVPASHVLSASSNKGAAAALRARLKPSSNSEGEKGSSAAAPAAPVAVAPALPPPPLSPPAAALPLDTAILPTLFFLGTGSAEPSAHRGASAMFLDVPGFAGSSASAAAAGILFDAGEGTAGALAKACWERRSGDDTKRDDDRGRRRTSLLPPSLRAVWLSHRHADHVLGLLGVLEARREEMLLMELRGKKHGEPPPPPCPPPLLVVGPHAVGRWLSEASAAAGWSESGPGPPPPPRPAPLSRVASAAPLYRFASAASLYQRHDPEGARRELEGALGLEAWVPVRADHCADAHGAVLWSKGRRSSDLAPPPSRCSSSPSCSSSSWSLAVSGDTVPTEDFARASRGVDLLVHEATFASGADGEGHAARKRHSTVAGALGVAAASLAGRTVLTHFSQRYPGLPPDALEAPAQWDAAGAVAAADGMTVRFGDLGRLEGLTGRTVDALGDEVEGKGDEGVGGGGGDGVERSPPGAKGDYEDGDDGENDEACCCGD